MESAVVHFVYVPTKNWCRANKYKKWLGVLEALKHFSWQGLVVMKWQRGKNYEKNITVFVFFLISHDNILGYILTIIKKIYNKHICILLPYFSFSYLYTEHICTNAHFKNAILFLYPCVINAVKIYWTTPLWPSHIALLLLSFPAEETYNISIKQSWWKSQVVFEVVPFSYFMLWFWNQSALVAGWSLRCSQALWCQNKPGAAQKSLFNHMKTNRKGGTWGEAGGDSYRSKDFPKVFL